MTIPTAGPAPSDSGLERAAARVICALDTPDLARAETLARRLGPSVGWVKLGLEFFAAQGPAGVRRIVAAGRPVFLDLKFHDIPNTVAGAVRAAAGLGAAMLNVHAAGGPAMLRAARQAVEEGAAAAGTPRPLLIAVTVLTSLADSDLDAIGQRRPAADQVRRLALLTREAGLDGVVCSPHEIALLRAECGPGFRLVVPGIRPVWAAHGDQARVMTPAEALAAGADHLVIGRPITGATDPAEAARRIAAELVAR